MVSSTAIGQFAERVGCFTAAGVHDGDQNHPSVIFTTANSRPFFGIPFYPFHRKFSGSCRRWRRELARPTSIIRGSPGRQAGESGKGGNQRRSQPQNRGGTDSERRAGKRP